MMNLINELKGKTYEEGKKVIESNLEVDSKILYSYEEDGRIDIYKYVENNENWICFTAPCEDVENDAPNIDYVSGYWSICMDNEVTTELQIK